ASESVLDRASTSHLKLRSAYAHGAVRTRLELAGDWFCRSSALFCRPNSCCRLDRLDLKAGAGRQCHWEVGLERSHQLATLRYLAAPAGNESCEDADHDNPADRRQSRAVAFLPITAVDIDAPATEFDVLELNVHLA